LNAHATGRPFSTASDGLWDSENGCRRDARELLLNRRLRRLELSLSDDGSVGIEHAECGGSIA
jgi:hypothetical protein